MSGKSNIEKATEIVKQSLFLFGAGATKDGGCKISREMLDDIQKMDLSTPEREAIDFLLSSLHYHASWKNLKEKQKPNHANSYQPNIEDLMMLIRRIVNRDSYLPYPITGSWADKINFLEITWQEIARNLTPAEPKTLFETLGEKFTRRLFYWLNIGKEKTDYLKPISDYLKTSKTDSPKLEFFTLNYDLVFEKYFNSNDETLLNTGFTQGYFYDFGKEDQLSSAYRINYYKLHGSLNWARDERGRIKESFQYSEQPDKIKSKLENQSEEQDTCEFVKHPHDDPHVIFGHGGKFLSVDPFLSLLYHFKDKLERKEIFFVIGYSFFDPYINNMLLEGISKENQNPKQMIVVNPQFSKKGFLKEDEKEDDISDNDWKNRFVDFVQNVQRSTYLSDLPGFNLTEISPELIEIIPNYTSDYFTYLFSDDGKGLAEIYNRKNPEMGDDIF